MTALCSARDAATAEIDQTKAVATVRHLDETIVTKSKAFSIVMNIERSQYNYQSIKRSSLTTSTWILVFVGPRGTWS